MNILVISADAEAAAAVSRQLTAGTVCAEGALEAGLRRLCEQAFDALLLDLAVAGDRGGAAYERAQALAPDLPIVLLCDPHDEAVALGAVERGAQDYLLRGRAEAADLPHLFRCARVRRGALAALHRSLDERQGRAEENLRQSEEHLRRANAELSRAMRLKDEFLSSMSHELRTPLNAVLGLAESLTEGVYGPLEERQRSAARDIAQSGQHLLSLINDILDLSKIEADRMSLELQPVLAKEICEASLRLVREQAQYKQISIGLSIAPGARIVQGDPRRLKQIFVNLLSNAVKFTPPGGKIGIEVEADAPARLVRFTFWDTGIGIPPEQIDRLFQPFVQLDSELSRLYSGTGLGLVLVRRLVNLHGGSVSVASEPGRGSRFTLTLSDAEEALATLRLPVPEGLWGEEGSSKAESSAPDPGPLDWPKETRPALQRGKILIAEDSRLNQVMLRDYLVGKGYSVYGARNGIEAIEQARALAPDLILMDIQMPELDGLEATRRIRAIPALARVPIVALTALAMEGDRERCLAAGASAYLSKPVELRALSALIDELLTIDDAITAGEG